MPRKPMPVFKLIPLDDLLIDHMYQRGIKPHAKKIAKVFDHNKVGVLSVSPGTGKDKGKYYVWDGQHRLYALRDRKYAEWMCEVTPYSKKEQARAFGEQADLVRKPNLIEKHDALYYAGDDEAVSVQNAVEEAGLSVGNKTKGNAHSVRALYDLHQSYGPDVLTDTMITVDQAWDSDTYGQASAMVGGVGRIFGEHTSQVTTEKMIHVLRSTDMTPKRLLSKTKEDGYPGGSKGFLEYKYFIILWNKKYRTNKLVFGYGDEDPQAKS